MQTDSGICQGFRKHFICSISLSWKGPIVKIIIPTPQKIEEAQKASRSCTRSQSWRVVSYPEKQALTHRLMPAPPTTQRSDAAAGGSRRVLTLHQLPAHPSPSYICVPAPLATLPYPARKNKILTCSFNANSYKNTKEPTKPQDRHRKYPRSHGSEQGLWKLVKGGC